MAEQPCHNFEFRGVLAIGIGPCVSSNWFFALTGQRPVRANAKS
jgi:hypothetical protein